MPFFRKSIVETECDVCKKPFPVSSGGVCEQCRRILCNDHLHGSILRRAAIGFGARIICVSCRAGETPSATTPEKVPRLR